MPPRRSSARRAADGDSAADIEPASLAIPSRRNAGRRVKVVPPSHAADPDIVASFPQGGAAAHRVYETLDIRHMIYTLLDRRTLAGMMRLERRGIESVANVLFKRINVANVKKISRKSARRSIYCEAVRILEICPPPSARTAAYKCNEPIPTPSLFEPTAFLADVATWRKTCPHIHTILNEYPVGDLDDSFAARFRADKIVVNLCSTAAFDVARLAFPEPSGPILPIAPTHTNMDIRHTIRLRTQPLRFNPDPYLGEANQERWARWCYHNHDLDRRITSCDAERAGQWPIPPLLIATFMLRRQQAKCEPLADFRLPSRARLISSNILRDLMAQVGPGLQKLEVTLPGLLHAGDLRVSLQIIDEACPNLRELDMMLRVGHTSRNWRIDGGPTFLEEFKPPMPGLSNLRKLEVRCYPGKQDPRVLAQYLSQLGGDGCAYVLRGLRNNDLLLGFDRMVKMAALPPQSEAQPPRVTRSNPLQALGDNWETA